MKRWSRTQLLVAAAATALVACGAMTPDVRQGGGDAGLTGGGAAAGGSAAAGGMASGGGLVDAGALASMYPTWELTDLQPASPRANQRYGLSVFRGQPLVVVLIEGF